MSKINVTIKGEGLAYSGTVDKAVAAEILSLCLAQDKTSLGTLVDPKKSIGVNRRVSHESPSEYFNRHNPITNPDKILTLAGYLKEVRAQDSFGPKELKAMFKDVGEILPANFNRDLRLTKKVGWIASDSGGKSFYVTNTGLQAIAGNFSKTFIGVKRRRKKKNNEK